MFAGVSLTKLLLTNCFVLLIEIVGDLRVFVAVYELQKVISSRFTVTPCFSQWAGFYHSIKIFIFVIFVMRTLGFRGQFHPNLISGG